MFDQETIPAILAALDLDDVETVADVNGCAPDLAIALHQRYGCRIVVLTLKHNGGMDTRSKPDFSEYMARLKERGVDADCVSIVSRPKDLENYDVIFSFDGLGVHGKVSNLHRLFDRALHPLSRVVIEIKKGSGSYPFLNTYGSCNTLIPVTNETNGLAVMSVEPSDTPAGEWSKVAAKLAGSDGFFNDFGEHSFLFVPRGDTLVVTFDNLDIAMTKRETRRPWGFEYIETNGWSMLGVMANGWTWFRAGEVEKKFLELQSSGFFDRFKRVVFYGASMGGYAAAAFSAAVPGATVFAVSPQSTLDKSKVPWEMRYKKAWDRDFSGPFGDASQSSQNAGDVHIMFDPYVKADASHAARFDGENVTLWRCPLMGHRLGSSLSQMGILQDIATATINGEMTPLKFYKLLRKRHDFPRFQRELAILALDRGHPELARKVCRYVLRSRKDRYFKKNVGAVVMSARANQQDSYDREIA